MLLLSALLCLALLVAMLSLFSRREKMLPGVDVVLLWRFCFIFGMRHVFKLRGVVLAQARALHTVGAPAYGLVWIPTHGIAWWSLA